MTSSALSPERRLLRNAWGIVAAMSVAGLAWGPSIAASVAAGGLLSALNVEGMARLVGALTTRAARRGTWLGVFWLLFRYLLLAIALFVIFSVWHANVIAVAIGLSAPVAAIILEWGFYSAKDTES